MLSCGNKRSVGRKYKKAGFPTTTKKSASSTRAVVHSLRHYRPMARSSWYTDEIEGFDDLVNSESHGTIVRVVFWPNSHRVHMLTPPIAECPINDCLAPH